MDFNVEEARRALTDRRRELLATCRDAQQKEIDAFAKRHVAWDELCADTRLALGGEAAGARRYQELRAVIDALDGINGTERAAGTAEMCARCGMAIMDRGPPADPTSHTCADCSLYEGLPQTD
jgi:RNA polymerase-binding transcription factor DksA